MSLSRLNRVTAHLRVQTTRVIETSGLGLFHAVLSTMADLAAYPYFGRLPSNHIPVQCNAATTLPVVTCQRQNRDNSFERPELSGIKHSAIHLVYNGDHGLETQLAGHGALGNKENALLLRSWSRAMVRYTCVKWPWNDPKFSNGYVVQFLWPVGKTRG